MSRSIAFIRVFESAPIGHSVERMLQDSFPEYTVRTIVLTKLLKRHPHIILLNLFPMLLLYGLDLLAKRKRPRGAFFATPFLFHQVKRLVKKQLQKDDADYLFSFQLQSFFDTSTDFMPHFVYTDHTHLANLTYPDFDRSQLYAPQWIALEKQIYERATAVFTRSTNINQSLIDQYHIPAAKIHCIYVGINTTGQAQPKPASHYQQKQILFVGIDWERKGGPTLLAAFKNILQTHPDAHLTIVGATPETNLPNCRVVGLVPVSQVDQYYQEATIFCLPTTLEPFGVVFVEAMTHQLPIIATQVGALSDMVIPDYNGYLVPPHNVADLTAALLSLLADSEKRYQFGQNSYQLAQERYNWQQVGTAARQVIMAAVGTTTV